MKAAGGTSTRGSGPLRRRMPLVAVLLLASSVGVAQTHDGGDPGRSSGHPFVFGPDAGPGVGDAEVVDVRVPVSFTVIPLEDRSWGLRLRMVGYAGIHDFQAADLAELDVQVQYLALTPGVELLVPAGGAWLLKPFTELGYARDFSSDLDYGVWSVGVRTLASWPVAGFDLTVGTKLQYLSTFRSKVGISDDFGQLQVGFDGRHPLPMNIAGQPADLGLYVIRNQFIDALISRPEGAPLRMEATNEMGLSLGTTPSARVWGLKLPRLGIGYRWGDNLRGLRLNFGFPF